MDHDEPDAELLSIYARERSEDAFAQIVKRHAGLVHGAAVRVLQDDALARDVGQEVFFRLAKRASGIDGEALPAWLHKTTYRAAVNVVRSESRRRKREERTESGDELKCFHREPNLPDHWDEAAEHLDAALLHLTTSDRRALLARFYEGEPFPEIGRAIGKSEGAARMQVSRALEKVSNFLKRRGVCIPAVTIATGLSTEFSKAAPAQALAAYSAVAGASVTAANSGISFSVLFTMTNTAKITIATTLAVVACGSAYFGLLHSDNPATEAITVSDDPQKELSKAEIVISELRKLRRRGAAISEDRTLSEDSRIAKSDALEAEAQDAMSEPQHG